MDRPTPVPRFAMEVSAVVGKAYISTWGEMGLGCTVPGSFENFLREARISAACWKPDLEPTRPATARVLERSDAILLISKAKWSIRLTLQDVFGAGLSISRSVLRSLTLLII